MCNVSTVPSLASVQLKVFIVLTVSATMTIATDLNSFRPKKTGDVKR